MTYKQVLERFVEKANQQIPSDLNKITLTFNRGSVELKGAVIYRHDFITDNIPPQADISVYTIAEEEGCRHIVYNIMLNGMIRNERLTQLINKK